MLHIGNQTVELESVKEAEKIAKAKAAAKEAAEKEEKKDEVMIDTNNKGRPEEEKKEEAKETPLAELYKPKCRCDKSKQQKCINCLEQTSG